MTIEKRPVMLSLPKDLETEVNELKKDKFYDKSYAEMYRQLIRSGITRTKICGVKKERSA